MISKKKFHFLCFDRIIEFLEGVFESQPTYRKLAWIIP
jgi:hypothetical protein